MNRHGPVLEIVERLAEADPTSAAAQRDPAVSLSKVGDAQAETGGTGGALLSRLIAAVPGICDAPALTSNGVPL